MAMKRDLFVVNGGQKSLDCSPNCGIYISYPSYTLDFALAKWELQIPWKSNISIFSLFALRQVVISDLSLS